MAIENFNANSKPSVLNVNWPEPADLIEEGDEHIRLLKTVVKNSYLDYERVILTSNKSTVKPALIPPANNNGTAGTGFGGFRYVIDGKHLKLYTS